MKQPSSLKHQIRAPLNPERCMDPYHISDSQPQATDANGKGKRKARQAGIIPPFRRQKLINSVKKHFTHASASHGALSDRVVLYGPHGLGKRTIATQVAEDITSQDGRKLLWINGINYVTFVKEYCSLYHRFTGHNHPNGLSLEIILARTKRLLEEHRSEWFMVVSDLGTFADDEPKLTCHLPNRGHVLVTSNDMLASSRAHNPKELVSVTRFISALDFANNATEIYVKGLADSEVQQLVRYICPDLLAVSWLEFGKLQRWARAVPMFLKVTSINLRLMRLDFRAYRTQFEKQFRIVHKANSETFSSNNMACHLATKLMWDELANHDVYAQKLLGILSVVCFHHSVKLRLVENLSIFKRTVIDYLTPALDLLLSLDIVTMSKDTREPEISIMRPKMAQWVWGTFRRSYPRDEVEHIIVSWTQCLSDELSTSHSEEDQVINSRQYTSCNVSRLFQLLSNIEDLCSAIKIVGFHTPNWYADRLTTSKRHRTRILDFLLQYAEALIADRRLFNHAGSCGDDALKILLGLHSLPFARYQIYIQRIRHIRVAAYLSVSETHQAEQDLGHAKRSLQRLTAYHENPEQYDWHASQGTVSILAPPLPPGALVSTAPYPPGNAPGPTTISSSTTQPSDPESKKPSSESTDLAKTLLSLRRRTEDLEAELLICQQRFTQAHCHLLYLLRPLTETSLSDPLVLAQRYSWMAFSLSSSRILLGDADGLHEKPMNFDGEALRYSHACMAIWATLPDQERWGGGNNVGVDTLWWVDIHVECLVALRKYKGALIFLPRLLETWEDLTTMSDPKVWRLARRLVECYIRLDMVGEAEKVVERVLEGLMKTDRVIKNFISGVEVLSSRDVYEVYGSGEGREMIWSMLVELARGYERVGSVITAEGLLRFCLGSWKRRFLCSAIEEIEIVQPEGTSEKELEEVNKKVDERNERIRARRKEMEQTWTKTAPLDWWALLIDVLVMQGKVTEPKRLVEDLTGALDQAGPACDRLDKAFQRRVEAYNAMCVIYQRALWAEEEGVLREWKSYLGDSRDRFLLRRAVKAFGSVTRRVRERRDFVSDIDINLISHAKRSKILNLLDRNWGHRHGCVPIIGFFDEDAGRYEPRNCDVMTHSTGKQKYLCDYWRYCQCKNNRKRAWSIGYQEFVSKRLIMEDDRLEQKEQDDRRKKMIQGDLDGWVQRIPAPGKGTCGEDCPCRGTLIDGLLEQEKIEENLWTYKEPVRPHFIPVSKVRPPYKNAKNKCNELSGDEMWLDIEDPAYDKEKGVRIWKWWQPELCTGDIDGENYIIPGGLDLPAVKITTVEDDTDAFEDTEPPELESPMDLQLVKSLSSKGKIAGPSTLTGETVGNPDGSPAQTESGERSEEVANGPSEHPQPAESSSTPDVKDNQGGNVDAAKKRKRKRDARWWFFNPADYWTREKRESIEKWLVMDTKTRKKYDREKKEIVILDENYIEIEKISDEEPEKKKEEQNEVVEHVPVAGEIGQEQPVESTAEGAEGVGEREQGAEAAGHTEDPTAPETGTQAEVGSHEDGADDTAEAVADRACDVPGKNETSTIQEEATSVAVTGGRHNVEESWSFNNAT